MTVIIAGAGLTGRVMAISLASEGIPITLIGPDLHKQNKKDQRSTAIMMEGVDFLKKIKAWPVSEKDIAPLKIMRIVNETKTVDFDAQEMNKDAFAINILNNTLMQLLKKQIKTFKNITYHDDLIDQTEYHNSHIIVKTKKNKRLKAQLLIGADGKQSRIREKNNIHYQSQNYKQKAFVCTVSHQKDHDNISTEIHRSGGPFTLVPMYGKKSALVWCDHNHVIDDILKQNKQSQENRIQKIIGEERLGKIVMISDGQAWPIHALKASRLIAPRTALIGEAAHAIAPIAAQGFNLSLRDIKSLSDILSEGYHLGLDLGSNFFLERYQKNRQTDIALRYYSIGFLNTLIANNSLPANILKKTGLRTMEWVSPLRHLTMRFGMRT